MIWCKKVTSPNCLLSFSDVMFICLCATARSRNHWLSKLASTFVLALIEEKSTPLNFLYFSTQLSLKILAKQSKTAKKHLHSLLNYSTWQKQETSPSRLLCFSDVMFTCQGELGEFMPASKLASTFILAFIKVVFMPLNRQ